MFIDSHAHLEHPDFERDLDAVIGRMRKAGVKCLNTGSNLKANERTLAITAEHKDVLWASAGLSPHDAPKADLEAELEFIRLNAGEIIAIGEVGLDYHYFKEAADRRKQQKAFEAQLELAAELKKPVVIHSREAFDEVLQTLASFKGVKAVLHCFLLNKRLEDALDAGCWVSVPTVKSKNRTKIFKDAESSKLLLETDSPFLWGSGRNEPVNVLEAYQALAEARGLGLNEAEKAIEANFKFVFGV